MCAHTQSMWSILERDFEWKCLNVKLMKTLWVPAENTSTTTATNKEYSKKLGTLNFLYCTLSPTILWIYCNWKHPLYYYFAIISKHLLTGAFHSWSEFWTSKVSMYKIYWSFLMVSLKTMLFWDFWPWNWQNHFVFRIMAIGKLLFFK